MKKVRITAIRKASYPDLMAKYENPIEHACDVEEGMSWIAVDGTKPQGFCDSAWGSMEYFVRELANGGGNFFDGWMKDPHSAMISCNDGFRPVSFYLEAIAHTEEKGKWQGKLRCGQKLWAINKHTGQEETVEIIDLFEEYFVVTYQGGRYRSSYDSINTKFFVKPQCKVVHDPVAVSMENHAVNLAPKSKTEISMDAERYADEKFIPVSKPNEGRSCDNCFLRASGACSSLGGVVCEDYRAKQNIPKEEIDSWPRYGDVTAYRMRDYNHFK